MGLIHVGGTWREAVVRDTPIVIAGNELPWFGPAPRPSSLPPRDADGLPLRVLLAHAPDQFAWAARHDFDLMLAGHNHGGQIRLPLLGPILAPSLSGVRYASGTFRRDKTVLHVSRGTGGLTPFRWNCTPEIALLCWVLWSENQSTSQQVNAIFEHEESRRGRQLGIMTHKVVGGSHQKLNSESRENGTEKNVVSRCTKKAVR